MLNKDQLTRYAELKRQERLIKNELDFLNEEVTRQVSEYISANDGTLPAIEGLGKFSIKRLKIWKYSPRYEEVKLALEDLKAEEQATGIATFEEKESLIFTGDKPTRD